MDLCPDGNNLHRVVVFRDGADKVGTVPPFSSYDSKAPEHLWSYLANYEGTTGGRVLAIPHNGNLSNGLMFPTETTQAGTQVDADYAQQRQRWEPVYEVTQIKGDGETHALLSPDGDSNWNSARAQPLSVWLDRLHRFAPRSRHRRRQ